MQIACWKSSDGVRLLKDYERESRMSMHVRYLLDKARYGSLHLVVVLMHGGGTKKCQEVAYI